MSESRVVTFLKNAAIIFGALGLLAYGILREAYYAYYQEFKVAPEQAGLDKSELLSAALVGPAIQLAFVLVVALVAVLLFSLLSWPFKVGLDRHDPWAPPAFSWARIDGAFRLGRKIFWPSVIIFTVIGTATVAAFLLIRANQAAHRAIDHHESLYAVTIGRGDYSLPVLEIRAIPAEVDWIGSKPIPSALIDGRPLLEGASKSEVKAAKVNECMMYIGETADTFLIYDELHGYTVTFPKGDVVVELRTHVRLLPSSCPLRAPQ